MVVLEIIRTHAEPLNYETVKLITDERRESFFCMWAQRACVYICVYV